MERVTEMVRIHRLSARYHLPPSRGEERERLDRVLRTVLDEALERALERAGVSLTRRSAFAACISRCGCGYRWPIPRWYWPGVWL